MKKLTLDDLIGKNARNVRSPATTPRWLEEAMARVIGTLTPAEVEVLKLRYKDHPEMLRRLARAAGQ